MKYLLAELERKLRNAQGGLVIVPIVDEIYEKLKDYRELVVLANYYRNIENPRNTVVINAIATSNLLRNMKRIVLWEPSEEYMRKMKISFTITSIPVREISPRIVSKERAEILTKVHERFNYPVIPSNPKEGEILSQKGIEVVHNIHELRSKNVILSRPLRESAYTVLRSKVLQGGHLVDITSTSRTHEDWEKVRMAEAGVFCPPSFEEVNGFDPRTFPERTNISLNMREETWKEFRIFPRSQEVDIKLFKDEIKFKNKRIFILFNEFDKISIKGPARNFTFNHDDVNTLIRIALGKDTEPFPTLAKECERLLQDRLTCFRIAAETMLKILSLPRQRNQDVYAEVSRVINRQLTNELIKGQEKKIESKYLGRRFTLYIKSEGKIYLVLRGESEKGTKLRSKIRIGPTLETMVKLRKVVTEWIRSSISS
ncbi:hypothetical protein [Sulfuracidifex tepidarius]|uniref:Uncharacterized protein n=1 Tax=Sulfuracidifex tepidarius TaxID=1294262 RepID=A0A510E706_9CREN|nr:hypothetical protein [Sulfuracidifex tepidarius]BBG25492.1 hypothetical protein IC006_2828 [Sulfuracidifex tepidarius]BBG28286.1 hypothetical protein IC007_2842 [Sulfuracidifex tepidarius]